MCGVELLLGGRVVTECRSDKKPDKFLLCNNFFHCILQQTNKTQPILFAAVLQSWLSSRNRPIGGQANRLLSPLSVFRTPRTRSRSSARSRSLVLYWLKPGLSKTKAYVTLCILCCELNNMWILQINYVPISLSQNTVECILTVHIIFVCIIYVAWRADLGLKWFLPYWCVDLKGDLR